MNYKGRRLAAVIVALGAVAGFLVLNSDNYEPEAIIVASEGDGPLATEVLGKLEVKGRAPKTGYAREEFYTNWPNIDGCDARNVILERDLTNTVLDGCIVLSGTLNDPYTGKVIEFKRGSGTSSEVQIDHVVALSDAWQKGAQYMDKTVRREIASDPLNLLAVDGETNMKKGDGDAATWLPPFKAFRCQYVARQISVKYRYGLWVTGAEKEAMGRVLEGCPEERTIGVE